MAGTWRISVEAVEGLQPKYRISDFARNVASKLQDRLDEASEDSNTRTVIIEVTDGRNVQKTKPFEVPDDGNLRINRVLFVPAPVGSRDLTIRAVRVTTFEAEALIGEATLPKAFGSVKVDLMRKEKYRGSVRLNVTDGLPTPPSIPDVRPVQPATTQSMLSAGPPSMLSAGPSSMLSAGPSSMLSAAQPAQSMAPNNLLAPSATTTLPPALLAAGTERLPGSMVQHSPAANSSWLPTPTPGTPSSAASPTQALPSNRIMVAAGPSLQSGSMPPVVAPNSLQSLGWVPQPQPGAAPNSQSLGWVPQPKPATVPESFQSLGWTSQPQPATASGLAAPLLAPGTPVVPADARPLRMRHPALPFLGTCDVAVMGIRGLPSTFQQPFVIIGLEGQEYLVEDLSRGGLQYSFAIGAVQSDITLYCFDASQSRNSPVGRILLPISELLWPAGEAPSLGRLRMSFEKDAPPFQRQFLLQFLPASELGNNHGDPAFVDRFEPGLSEARRHGPEHFGAFGEVLLSIEVNLTERVPSLMGLYLESIIAGAQGFTLWSPELERPLEPELVEPSALHVANSPTLRSLLSHLSRLKNYTMQPSMGFVRFLQEEPWHGYMAAACWFLFCVMGFFPCSLWLLPIYIWLALLGNGLLAASQRSHDWECKGQEAQVLFASSEPSMFPVPQEPGGEVWSAIAIFRRRVLEVEPFVRLAVVCLERASNALNFADGPASTACFLALGAACGLLSLSLLIITTFDPELSFICGLYGAVGMVMMSRRQQAPLQGGKAPPRGFQLALCQALSCVPHQADFAHRFVASRVQRRDA